MRILSTNEQIVFDILTTAAEAGEQCPTNADFATILGYNSRSVPIKLIQRLERFSLIRVERFQTSRRVTITANGAKTALGERQGISNGLPKRHWTLRRRHRARGPISPFDIPPAGRCQWPLGHVGDPDFHFCGAPTSSHNRPDPDRAYCPEHHARAYDVVSIDPARAAA